MLIDGFGGGFLLSPAYHRLRRQGVPVARFLHSTLPWKMPFLDLRLHKKCLVVDGEIAFVGGLNIGAENLVATSPKSPVRDCHFRLAGTILRQIEQQFDDDWLFTTREAPIDFHDPPPATSAAAAAARAIVSGPDQETDKLVLVLLSRGQRGAALASRSPRPISCPTSNSSRRCNWRRMRGVEVDLVLPGAIITGWSGGRRRRIFALCLCRDAGYGVARRRSTTPS